MLSAVSGGDDVIDLNAIEARWKATTEGTWRRAHHGTWEVEAVPNQMVADFGTIDKAAEDATFAASAHQDIPALVAEVRRLRATSLPTRIDAPDGHTAEVVSVRVRRATPTGGTWHESMSVERWRRQGNVREELLDSGGGGDRKP